MTATKTYAKDTSVPVQSAYRLLGLPVGELSLDELARLLSLRATEYGEEFSVRNPGVRPIPHSRVYRNGEPLDLKPHLTRC